MSELWDKALEKAVEQTRKAVEAGKAITPEQELEFSLRYNREFMDDAINFNLKNGTKIDPKVMDQARRAREIIADIFNDPNRSLNLFPVLMDE